MTPLDRLRQAVDGLDDAIGELTEAVADRFLDNEESADA